MAILSKLGPNYSVFVLTFHATKLTAQSWKMPKIAEFMESLTQEQDKLVLMVIHMDIGGHPPIPLAQNNCLLWQFPSYFSTVFWVPNFWDRFEALNDVFW